MPATVTVNLRAIRTQIGNEIANLEKAIQLGEQAVAEGRSQRRVFSGSARDKKALEKKVAQNTETLSKAKKMLKKLERQEVLMANECCDKQIQNCNLLFL